MKLNRILFLILVLLCAHLTGRATDITVGAFSTGPIYQQPDTIVVLRVYYSDTIVDSGETVIVGGPAGSSSFYKTVTCTLNTSTKVVSCPSFSLPSTTDSSRATATVTGVLFGGKTATTLVQRVVLFTNWRIPTVPASTTFADLNLYNLAKRPTLPDTYYTTAQIDAKLALIAGGGGSGVDSVFGRTGNVVATNNDYSAAQLSNGTTGSGQVVLKNSPALTAPDIGVANATSINKLGITPPATNATLTIAEGKTLVVNNSVTLAGSSDGFTFTVPGTGTGVLSTRTITEGVGLAGNTYDLSANRTLALGLPSSLSASSSNSVAGTTHSHAITSSANPGTAASLLASNSNGYLQLVRLGLGVSPNEALEVNGNVLISTATANLYLKDTQTGWQSTASTVITPQASNVVRSTSYTSGLVGWNINASGNAEFNNVEVRGSIHAGIITYNALQSTAGTLGVFRSAAKLRADVSIPSSPTYGSTTVTIDVVDPDGVGHISSQLFAINDVLRLKESLAGDTWLKVTAASDQSTFWRYTAAIMAGSNNVTYRTGLGVADYGPTGSGFIIQTADQTNSPYLQMATHTASFTSTDAAGTLSVTPQLRLGNLNGSYGYLTDVYGLGTGQYGASSKSWLTIEQTNGLRIGNNTTTLAQWDTSGAITIGQVASGQSNVQISSGAVKLRNNTTARIQLNSDGSGAVADGNISWSSGGTASIAGWTVNSSSISTGTTYIASGLDAPAAPFAWFGKSATGYRGVWLADSLNRFLTLLTDGGLSPRIVLNDGTRNRTVIGDLNNAWGSDGATNSMGMKIWNSSGTKLVEFSDVQNVISGWTIGANSFTAGSGSTTVGLDTTSTGGDDIRIYAGNSTPSSAPFRVTEAGVLTATNATITGSLTAGSGNALANSSGFAVKASSAYASERAYKVVSNSGSTERAAFWVSEDAGTNHAQLEALSVASENSTTDVTARAPTSFTAQINLKTYINGVAGNHLDLDGGAQGLKYNGGTFWVDGNSNIRLGNGAMGGTDTTGFTYIRTVAGAPSGTPSSVTGMVPLVYDSTNNKLYIYNGGWKQVGLAP